MNIKIIFCVLVLILGLFLGNLWHNYVADNLTSRKFCQFVQDKTRTTMRISELTQFQWQKLYIFGPYTSNEEIAKTLGFEWSEVSSTNIDYDESINLLIFVADTKVVHSLELPRSCGDFQRNVSYTPEEANFIIIKEEGNGHLPQLRHSVD